MPDPTTPNPNPTAPATSSPTSGQPAPAGQQAPGGERAWAQKFKSDDDLWKAYGELESKLGQQGNELGQYRNAYDTLNKDLGEHQKAVKAWDQWYRETLANDWDDVQKYLSTKRGKQVAQNVAQSTGATTNATQNWSEGWDTLSPQQQATRLREVAVQEIAGALTPALQNWQKQFGDSVQKNIADKEAYFNNYLNLYRKVMDMRIKNPNLDVDAVLDQAVNVLGGKIDPIELGRTLATASQDREAYAKQMLEQARKDWEQEQENKKLAAIQPQAGGTPPVFKTNASNSKNGLGGMREQVAKAILEKHGPTAF